jgi:hypothetical protein
LISRLFGSKEAAPAKGVVGLDARLAKLEEEAQSATPGYKGLPLNKAGDFALRDGDRALALEYYGRAIDTFLEDQQREAARGVANKLIRVHPEAVRTLCTLTWLDLGARHMATALLHLRDYVAAVKRVEQNQLAGDQIFEMARVAPQSEFLQAAADALDALDLGGLATEVRGWAASGGSPGVLEDDDELAAACLFFAVKTNTRSSGSSGR